MNPYKAIYTTQLLFMAINYARDQRLTGFTLFASSGPCIIGRRGKVHSNFFIFVINALFTGCWFIIINIILLFTCFSLCFTLLNLYRVETVFPLPYQGYVWHSSEGHVYEIRFLLNNWPTLDWPSFLILLDLAPTPTLNDHIEIWRM